MTNELNLSELIVSGFWEEEYPHFTQGLVYHEMVSPVTAEECNALVQCIKKRNDVLSDCRNLLKSISCHHFDEDTSFLIHELNSRIATLLDR